MRMDFARTRKALGLTDHYPNIARYYRMPYPLLEFETGRQLRMSPIYPRLRDAGAMFGQTMGYERPGYYDPEYKGGST